MRKLKVNAIYRHFKGDYYLVIDKARDSETKEEMVVYRRLYGDMTLWVRPLSMFLWEVEHKKYPKAKQKYRFKLVKFSTVADKFNGISW